jgi:hypothetical protein
MDVVPVETEMVTNDANVLPLFNLMQDFIYDTDLESSDTKRKAIQIIKKAIDDMKDEILIRGHHYTTVMKLRELKDLALSDWT